MKLNFKSKTAIVNRIWQLHLTPAFLFKWRRNLVWVAVLRNMKVSFAANTYHARTQHKYLRLFFVQDKQGVKPDIQFLSKNVLARIRNGILNIMFF